MAGRVGRIGKACEGSSGGSRTNGSGQKAVEAVVRAEPHGLDCCMADGVAVDSTW